MAWSTLGESKIFRQFVADLLAQTVAYDLNATGALKAALYNDTATPDGNAVDTAIAYNTGAWVVANEVSQAGQWAAGGVAPAGAPTVSTPSSGVVMLDAADVASGSAATLTGVVGTLVYADLLTAPRADPGVCFNYFGGAQSVTNGTFSVLWNNNGIFRITV
jgi:hypothetical protein